MGVHDGATGRTLQQVGHVHGDSVGDDVYEDKLKPSTDWWKRTERYFASMSPESISRAGLAHNRYCFKAILDYPVTNEILAAEKVDLGQFEFAY